MSRVIGAIGGIVFVVLFIVALLLIGPALLMWSINTFLEQSGSTYQVPFNFWTWLAGMVMLMLVGSTARASASKS